MASGNFYKRLLWREVWEKKVSRLLKWRIGLNGEWIMSYSCVSAGEMRADCLINVLSFMPLEWHTKMDILERWTKYKSISEFVHSLTVVNVLLIGLYPSSFIHLANLDGIFITSCHLFSSFKLYWSHSVYQTNIKNILSCHLFLLCFKYCQSDIHTHLQFVQTWYDMSVIHSFIHAYYVSQSFL